MFKYVVDQARPIYKYESRDGLNKEFGKRSISLINILFDILLSIYPQVAIQGAKYLKGYFNPDDSSNSTVEDALKN